MPPVKLTTAMPSEPEDERPQVRHVQRVGKIRQAKPDIADDCDAAVLQIEQPRAGVPNRTATALGILNRKDHETRREQGETC